MAVGPRGPVPLPELRLIGDVRGHGRRKWLGACNHEGEIFGIPGHAHGVLRIEPRSERVECDLGDEGPLHGLNLDGVNKFKWLRGVSASGKVWGIPMHAERVPAAQPLGGEREERFLKSEKCTGLCSKWTRSRERLRSSATDCRVQPRAPVFYPQRQEQFAFRCRLVTTVRFQSDSDDREFQRLATVTWLSRTLSIVTRLDTRLTHSQKPTSILNRYCR